MYFDAILTPDLTPIFNGTPEETVVWLKENPIYLNNPHYRVCIGETLKLISPWEYVNMYK